MLEISQVGTRTYMGRTLTTPKFATMAIPTVHYCSMPMAWMFSLAKDALPTR